MIEVVNQPEKYRLSIEDAERMTEVGILSHQQRVELIHGDIFVMTPIGQRHVSTVIMLSGALADALGERVVITEQNAVELGPNEAPQPDITVLKSPRSRYRNRRPNAQDIYMLVEVADSSLKYDREIKLPLYAEANIPEVWIVNLNEDVLELYRQPKGKFYGQKLVLLPDETVSPLAFPDISLDWQL